MALARFTKPVDGTIPIQALLYPDEELISSQDGVGIYDGLQKSPEHQNGTVHITNHRIFYIDASKKTSSRSFALDLEHVSQTDYYAGLFTSSSKVTLHLHVDNTELIAAERAGISGFESWECEVCAYRNPPGLSPSAAKLCGLCGVPRNSTAGSSSVITSTSLPSSVSTSAVPRIDTSNRKPSSVPCPACTFLNHSSMKTCEICDTPLLGTTPSTSAVAAEPGTTKSAPGTRSTTPGLGSDEEGATGTMMIKLSFRKGGDKAFYTALKRSLKGQAWEVNAISTRLSNVNTTGNGTNVRSGISGIMHAVETRAQTRDTHMSDALKDLEALMVKAKDMVKLAGELNERLTAVSAASSTTGVLSSPSLSSTSIEPEEATFIRSSLSQLGLAMENTPVTMDMIKDERIWVEELARELGGVLQGSRTGTRASEGTGGGMMKRRGIIALDEVWGGWNRARGVALIPPSTLVLVLPHLPTYTNPPIRALELPSSLKVLHAPEYAPGAFGDRIRAMLAIDKGGATATQDIGGRAGVPKSTLTSTSTTEIAQAEGITIALAEEMVQLVERDGGVSRDDGRCVIHERLSGRSLEHDGETGGGAGAWTGGGEVKWWINVFVGYVWDGQE